MIRETTQPDRDYERMSPEELPVLTPAEQAACDNFDINVGWKEVVLSLPPEERDVWKVVDEKGSTICRYKQRADADFNASNRNAVAKHLGLKMRYRVEEDQGWDE